MVKKVLRTVIIIIALAAVLIYSGTLVLAINVCKEDVRAEQNLLDTECEYSDVLQFIKTYIPEKMQKAVTAKGYTLKVSDGIKGGFLAGLIYGVGGSMSGLTDYGARTIYVSDTYKGEKISAAAFAGTFMHEYGHAVSHTYGMLAESKDFEKAYREGKRVKSQFSGAYTVSSSDEYFADMFAFYITSREDVKNDYPITVAYFDKLFADAAAVPENTTISRTQTAYLKMFAQKTVNFIPLIIAVIMVGIGLTVVIKIIDKKRKSKS